MTNLQKNVMQAGEWVLLFRLNLLTDSCIFKTRFFPHKLKPPLRSRKTLLAKRMTFRIFFVPNFSQNIFNAYLET